MQMPQELLFTEGFEHAYLRPLGVDRAFVRSTIANAARVERLTHQGYACTLLLGHPIESGALPLIVIDTDAAELKQMYLIPPNLTTHPKSDELIFLLERFADRFGLPIQIDGISRRLHYRTDFLIPKMVQVHEIINVHNPDNVAFHLSLFATRRNYSATHDQIWATLVIALDSAAYNAWLRGDSDARASTPFAAELAPELSLVGHAKKFYPIGVETRRALRSLITSKQLERLTHPGQIELHPLVAQLEAVESVLRSEASWGQLDISRLRSCMQSVFDVHTWVKTSDIDHVWDFIPDPLVRSRIRQNVLNPKSYHEVLAQLHFWGLLREAGISSRLIELPGAPDLNIHPSETDVVGGEVKCISLSTNPQNLKNHIRKANLQLKQFAEERSGVMFIKCVSVPVRTRDDSVPKHIAPFVDVALGALQSGHYRNVGQVLVSWDDYFVGEKVEGKLYCFRRRSLIIENSYALTPPLLALESLVSMGATFYFHLVRRRWEYCYISRLPPGSDYGSPFR